MREGSGRRVRGGLAAVGLVAFGAVLQACSLVAGVNELSTEGNCEKWGIRRCRGSTLERCDADGTWRTEKQCENQACNMDRLECEGNCAPEQTRCAGSTPQVCSERGEWEGSEACTFPEHCQGGECVLDCTLGDVRCAQNKRQFCDAGEWKDKGTCEQSTCLDGECVGECAPLEGDCQGQSPVTCGPGGVWQYQTECMPRAPGNGECAHGSCPGPSCDGLAASCGADGDESCCVSPVVAGGSYFRSNNPSYPATVSDFRLDRFEITVGRFRKFVDVYDVAGKPGAGAGAHPGVPNSGWRQEWTEKLPANRDALEILLSTKCPLNPEIETPCYTWTHDPGANEGLPMNCLDWYTAFAFCAWDGGRLPSEAEWNYAAAGGVEQRTYPWANPPGSLKVDPTYALYDCLGYSEDSFACTADDILAVGSRSPRGDGRWGHADLAGSVWEWTMDAYQNPYPEDCHDCIVLDGEYRVVRGGSWFDFESQLVSSVRDNVPAFRSNLVGARCARAL